MAEWIGRTLSKVEIEKRLGRGGMAELYLGRHTTLDRPVAVKVLHPHLSDNETVRARFLDEAKAVATLRHSNIVQVFDFDVVDDRPYIVMELIEGIPLSEYLHVQSRAGRVLTPETTARLIGALAAALDYAHARGIIHRDVKPSNVMLRRESGPVDPEVPLPPDVQPVLTDFGIARLTNVTARTASGEIIGTPAYMSPEQVRGESIDARSDIYSLGIMLYEMLAGKAPFDPDTETAAAILVKHMTEAPPALPGATPELQAVLDRALAKDPSDRYQRAGDLAAAMNAALGLPVPDVGSDQGLADALMTAPMGTVATQVEDEGSAARRGGINPLLIVVGVGGLLLVLAVVLVGGGLLLASLVGGGRAASATEEAAGGEQVSPESGAAAPPAGEEVQGQDAQPPVDTSTPRGVVTFAGPDLSVTLFDLEPPPDGFEYEAWLLAGPDGEDLSLGVTGVSDGQAALTFTDPSGENLITRYRGFMLSVEPVGDSDPSASGQIAYRGQFEDDALQRLRHFVEETGGQPFDTALLTGLSGQAEAYNSHLSFAVDAANAGDLDGTKLHSEHVINISEGSLGPDFGDWNGDGQAQNPGDVVGMLPYLLIVQDAARRAATLPDATPEVQGASETISADTDALLATVGDARDLAKRIAATDTMEEAQPLVAELDGLRTQSAVDALLQDLEGMELSPGVVVFAVAS